MSVYYECDYNKLPFKDVIKLVFGEELKYSSYAHECYKEHKYIFKTSINSIYGDKRQDASKIIKLSSLIKESNIGRL